MQSDREYRSISLDVLRAVAVLLVVGLHADVNPILTKIGWIGVDLFFVLSGFLISRLLFKEYLHTGQIRIGSFYIRRAFKIYPSFWLLLALTPVLLSRTIDAGQWLAELLFVQNYFDGIWAVTWSLAVEEHFYLALPVFLVLLSKRRVNNPFAPILYVAIALIVLCALLRVPAAFAMGEWPVANAPMLRTHVRIDELFIGVLAGYWYCYHPELTRLRLKKWHTALTLLPAAGILIILCCTPRIVFLAAYPFLSTGFAALVLTAAFNEERSAGTMRRGFAMIGRSSYALYLWHIAIAIVLTRLCGVAPGSSAIVFVLYLGTSIGFSIVLTRGLEEPLLRLRDRWFPREGRPDSDAHRSFLLTLPERIGS